jgi:hypothetical protein
MDPHLIQQIIDFQNENLGLLRGMLVGYEDGTHFTGEIRDGERIDTTRETIAALKTRIGKIEHLVQAYHSLLRAST